MNIQQRSNAIEAAKGCPRCTCWRHQKQSCKMPANSCGEDIGGGKCSGDHSKLLHGTTNVYCAAISANLRASGSDLFACVKEDEEAIFYLQDIPVKGPKRSARVFWDQGSNRVLIRDDFAKSNKLIHKDVTYTIDTVGNGSKQEYTGKIYLLDLVDMHNNSRTVWGYGISCIMESSRPSLLPIRKLFPHLPNAAFNSLASKQVDVLIGLNMSELAPTGSLGTDRVGGLTTLRSAFGCGWVIGGHSDLIRSTPTSMYCVAASLKIAKLQVIPDRSCTPEFWEAEGMGVLPPPRCESCLSCLRSGACSDKNHTHSVKKQAELELIQSKMELKNGEVWCQYPFVKDPASLSYNRASAVKVADRVERGLIKDGLYATYNEQIQSQLDRGVAIKLSEDEITSWSGPCQ